MTPELLLQHFDRISEAPDAIPRLRRFILDLAVRGKLVEQDPNDEPAGELLKRIQAEKERLGVTQRRKDAKKGKNGVDSRCDVAALRETAFDLPVGWEWVRLGELGTTQTGTTPSTANSEYFGDDYPFIKPADIHEKGVRYDSGEGLSIKGVEKGRLIQAFSVLMVCIGGSIGKVNFVDRDCSCNQQINVITPYKGIDYKLLTCFMASHFFKDQVLSNAPGTTLPILSKGKWENLPIPLPPLAEQQRIVTKVDELMALCDQLEAERNQREAHRDKLVAASLQQLAEASPPPWRGRDRVGGKLAECTLSEASPTPQPPPVKGGGAFLEPVFLLNFQRLTTKPEHIKQLRQAILNLAVRGKLVEQAPNDEPACELLKRIQAEKERLGLTPRRKDAKIGKNGVDSLGSLATWRETAFDLPVGWEWVRLGDMGTTQTGTTPSTANSEYFGDDYPFIKPADIHEKGVRYDSGEGLSIKGVEKGRLTRAFSVLMVCIGGSIGKVNFIDQDCSCNQQINAITPYKGIDYRLLTCFMASHFFKDQVLSNAPGTTLPILSKGKWENLLVPLPPLAEQHRIVAKVNELMGICDQLEAQLTTSAADSRRLLEAVLHTALEPALQEAA